MEQFTNALKTIQASTLNDRRLMIIILKKYSNRRAFSENCRMTKIMEERRKWQNGPVAQTFKEEGKILNLEKEQSI